ncbi:cbb3-type cytochrome oxidase assembly protein CcoS [Novosphingobium sp. TH158]|uniref:cbb3-type cytochrome oxidase assembly protein CcoS n=1 Tax=Novosphingobium sp. TH158 TaxID=2067455 RepID=UPI000C7BEE5F|nr:cbb3-type cytochrome oxidase assembly protein CcoS [Novosphingobium sp. TH158]PLK24360.1 cbb3-type cytochrome oxidase assembly protein CcoS [Novosphingobium sp. TH158]
MNSIALLIPLALVMGSMGLFAFFWSLKRGQFDDMEGSANRILIDDEGPAQ